VVYITGAVLHPGVVEMEQGDRLHQAIGKVGGFTEDALVESVNQAMILKDEQQIDVLKEGEENRIASVEEEKDDRININEADITELKTLSGIGDVIAQAIVDYRTENKGFSDIDELKEVHRIGEKTFEKIKDYVYVP